MIIAETFRSSITENLSSLIRSSSSVLEALFNAEIVYTKKSLLKSESDESNDMSPQLRNPHMAPRMLIQGKP